MSTPYTAGRRAEYAAIKQLRQEGYAAVRTAGSHGPFDIVAWNTQRVILIQVKKVKAPLDIKPALAKAKAEMWTGRLPVFKHLVLEIWIRYDGHFYIFSPPFISSDRRII